MNHYEVWLADNLGVRESHLATLTRLEYGRKMNEVSWCQIELPNDAIDFSSLDADKRIIIMKSIDDGTPFLAGDCCWFLRKWKRNTNQGLKKVTLWGASPNYLIGGREILYAAGTSQAKKNNKKPNTILYEIINENLGSGAVAGRDLSAYLTIISPTPVGTSINKSCAWREVGKTLQEISELAAENGEYLFYDVTYDPDTALFAFQIYHGQRGVDHSTLGSDPVIFSEEFGNLDNIEEMFDYSNEVTAAIALGKGEEAQRATNEQTDATRIALSPFGRREKAKDATSADTTADLTDEAKSVLREGLPVKNFTADLLDIGVIFDVDYGWGDRVTMVDAEGTEHHCFVDSYTVSVESGKETIKTTTREIQ